jgi:phosphoglycolate phosphatase
MQHTALLFDLDGTLVDGRPGILAGTAEVAASLGLEMPDEAMIVQAMGLGASGFVRALWGNRTPPGTIAAFWRTYKDIFDTVVLPPATVFPGVADALAAWHAEGRRIGIVTSQYRVNAERLLEHTGLRVHVDAVIGSDMVARPKPAGDTVLAALRELERTPADAVVVGDTIYDVGMAIAARVPAYGVTYGSHPAADLLDAGALAIFGRLADLTAHLR